MSYIITIEQLDNYVNSIIIPFINSIELEPLNIEIEELDNIKDTLYLRAFLLIQELIKKESNIIINRFLKELFIIISIEEIRLNYIDYYKENKSK